MTEATADLMTITRQQFEHELADARREGALRASQAIDEYADSPFIDRAQADILRSAARVARSAR